MTKHILIFSLAIAMTFSLTAYAGVAADRGIAQLEQVESHNINITVSGSTLVVSGASGQTLEVVSLTGRKVTTVKIGSSEQRIELNIPKGCYILKIGSVVRKVSIC